MHKRCPSRSRRRVSQELSLSGRVRCQSCAKLLQIHHNAGGRSPSRRCEECGRDRCCKYVENTILAGLAVLARSNEFEGEVEAEIRKTQEYGESEKRLARLAPRRDQMALKLDKAIDALLERRRTLAHHQSKGRRVSERSGRTRSAGRQLWRWRDPDLNRGHHGFQW